MHQTVTIATTDKQAQAPPSSAPRSAPRRPPSATNLTARAAAGALRHGGTGPLPASPSLRSMHDTMDAQSEGMSMQGSDDLSSLAGEDEFWPDQREGDNVRVVIRMRPANETEVAERE